MPRSTDPRRLNPGAKADPELDARTHRSFTGEGLSRTERDTAEAIRATEAESRDQRIVAERSRTKRR